MEFLDIQYTSDPDHLRKFDLYAPSDSAQKHLPIVIYVHGGAWRSEDKGDHKLLAKRLVDFTNLPVAIPNYRLTPRSPTSDNSFCHPGHAEDILSFLSYLNTWQGPPTARGLYDPQRMYLMGHSCSAHMIASIFLDSSSASPSLIPPKPVLSAVQAIVMSEGIYDIDLLLSSFPAYREWFIENTFGQQPSYASYSVTELPARNKDIRWFLIHSKGDTLVDQRQTDIMFNHLREMHGTQITRNTDQFTEEHNNLVHTEEYSSTVGKFILEDISSLARV